jgi:hypothetical protein
VTGLEGGREEVVVHDLEDRPMSRTTARMVIEDPPRDAQRRLLAYLTHEIP